MRGEDAPLDVLPWRAALDTLCARGITRDDEMHDYTVSQAYRAVAYALSDGATSPDGSIPDMILKDMSVKMLESASLRCTVVFLLVRLSLEEGSAHGETNRVPRVAHVVAQRLATHGSACLERVSSDGSILDRRHALGFTILIRELVMSLAATLKGQHAYMCSVTPAIFDVVLRELMPLIAMHAEGLDDRLNRRMPSHASAEGMAEQGVATLHTDPPTRRTVESNLTVAAVVSCCLEDLASADAHNHRAQAPETDEPKSRLIVVDTAFEPLVWTAAQLLRNVARRQERWLWASAHRLKATANHRCQADTHPNDHQGGTNNEEPLKSPVSAALLAAAFATERWPLGSLVALWDREVHTPLEKRFQELASLRLQQQRAYGGNSEVKDVRSIAAAMWGCTVQLCILCSAFSRGLLVAVTNHGASSAGMKDILCDVASQIARHVTPLEGGDESPQQSFMARMTMLSVASVLFFQYPMNVQQEALWSQQGDGCRLTEAFHQAVVMGPLRYKDTVVVNLAAMMSSSVLAAVSIGAQSTAMDIGGDALLELLRTARGDGATRGAVQIVAMACLARPQYVVPQLFRLLSDKDSAEARANALDVLDVLPPLIRAALSGYDDTDSLPVLVNNAVVDRALQRANRERLAQRDRLRDVLRTLGDHLLEHLGEHEALDQRLHAASLFAMLEPQNVVRPLLLMQLRRDASGKRRGAAARALVSVLAGCTVVEQGRIATYQGVTELVNACAAIVAERTPLPHGDAVASTDNGATAVDAFVGPRAPSMPIPRTPADVLIMSQLHNIADDQLDVDGCGTASDGHPPASPSNPQDIGRKLMQVAAAAVSSWLSACIASEAEDANGVRSGALITALFAAPKSAPAASLEFAQQLSVRLMTTATSILCRTDGSARRRTTAARNICVKCTELLEDHNATATSPMSSAAVTGEQAFQLVFPLVCLRMLPTIEFDCDDASPSDIGSSEPTERPSVLRLLRVLTEWFLPTSEATKPQQRMRAVCDDTIRKLALEVLSAFPAATLLPRFVPSCLAAPPTTQGEGPIALTLHDTIAHRAFFFLFGQRIVRHSTLLDLNAVVVPFCGDQGDGSKHSSVALRDGQYLEGIVPFAADAAWSAMGAAAMWGSSAGTGTKPSDAEDVRRVWMSSVDALALMFVVSLRFDDTTMDAATSDPPTRERSWVAVGRRVLQPLVDFVEQAGDAAQQLVDAILSTIDILHASVKIVVHQQTQCKGWTALWARKVLRRLIRCANAGVVAIHKQRAEGRDAQCANTLQIVVKCVSVVFSLLVVQPSRSSSGNANENVEREAVGLDVEDEEAIVEFALGCLQYEPLPTLQFEGVKLAAACMTGISHSTLQRLPAAAPRAGSDDALVSCIALNIRMLDVGGAVPGPSVPGDNTLVERLVNRLARIALMHRMPEARQLAQHIVDTISSK